MSEIQSNCWDLPCKYCNSDLDTLMCEYQCEHVPKEVSELIGNCPHFEIARTCIDCKHSRPVIYGALGDGDENTDYFCPFIEDGKKLVYSDVSTFSTHYSDVPECPCGRFEYYDKTRG